MTALALIVLLVAGIAVYYMTMSSGQAQGSPSPQDTSVIASNFRVLSQAHTDVCAYLGNQQANANYINSLADNFYLQGSCCFPMDYNHYVSQTNGLKNYSDIPIIPQNPYNVSASHAKGMMSYATLTMTQAQQAVYDNAAKASRLLRPARRSWRAEGARAIPALPMTMRPNAAGRAKVAAR